MAESGGTRRTSQGSRASQRTTKSQPRATTRSTQKRASTPRASSRQRPLSESWGDVRGRDDQPKVFINYRRADTAPYAGRLYDALTAALGHDHVFMDIDKIKPGVDFVEEVEEAVDNCHVVVALIGPTWLAAKDAKDRTRLEDPKDYVRLEIATALKRDDVRVIPVLVGGAAMPNAEDLPRNLAPLARREALDLADDRWKYDVARLVDAIRDGHTLGNGSAPPLPPVEVAPPHVAYQPEGAPPRKRPSWQLPVFLGGGAALVILVVVLALVLTNNPNPPQPTTTVPPAPTNSAPANGSGGGGSSAAFPNADEQDLLTHIPQSIQDQGCKRNDDLLGANAAIECLTNDQTLQVEYRSYDASNDMRDGLRASLNTDNINLDSLEQQDKGYCDPRNNPDYETAWREYNLESSSRTIGEEICYTSSQGDPWIEWTDTRTNIWSRAASGNSDKAQGRTDVYNLFLKAGPNG